MRIPRLTIGRVMLATVLLAANLGILRPLIREEMRPNRGDAWAFLVVGALPMANALAIGLAWCLARRCWTPRAAGFQAAGWILLGLFASLAVINENVISEPLELGLTPLLWLWEWLGRDPRELTVTGPPAFLYWFLNLYVAAAVSGPMAGLSWLAARLAGRYGLRIARRPAVSVPAP